MIMENRETKWTPMKALGRSAQYLQTLNVPEFTTNLEDSGLDYGNLLNCDNKQLEEFLLVYGGFKAYLEGQVSDAVTKRNALEAAFDEGYATAIYRIADERETEGKKKLTREEIRGAVMDRYEQLKELRRELIEQEAIHSRLSGLLNAYKAAYDAVSRVVTLRTYGEFKSNG